MLCGKGLLAATIALVTAIREKAAERGPLPDPLPDPPPIPYEYLQRLGLRIDSTDPLSPMEQSAILIELRQALDGADEPRTPVTERRNAVCTDIASWSERFIASTEFRSYPGVGTSGRVTMAISTGARLNAAAASARYCIGGKKANGSVAAADMVGWPDEVPATAAVPEAKVRTRRHCYFSTLALPLLPESV